MRDMLGWWPVAAAFVAVAVLMLASAVHDWVSGVVERERADRIDAERRWRLAQARRVRPVVPSDDVVLMIERGSDGKMRRPR